MDILRVLSEMGGGGGGGRFPPSAANPPPRPTLLYCSVVVPVPVRFSISNGDKPPPPPPPLPSMILCVSPGLDPQVAHKLGSVVLEGELRQTVALVPTQLGLCVRAGLAATTQVSRPCGPPPAAAAVAAASPTALAMGSGGAAVCAPPGCTSVAGSHCDSMLSRARIASALGTWEEQTLTGRG